VVIGNGTLAPRACKSTDRDEHDDRASSRTLVPFMR